MLECLKKIGPGAIVASATIGAGETVLAVRAGAWGGYNLLWLILLATATKSLLTLYMLGRYSAVSGQSVIEKLVDFPGPRGWLLWVILSLETLVAPLVFVVIAVPCSRIMSQALSSLGVPVSYEWLAMIFISLAIGVGMIQHYETLEKSQLIVCLILLLGTVTATIFVGPDFKEIAKGFFRFGYFPSYPEWVPSQVSSRSPLLEMAAVFGYAGSIPMNYLVYSNWILIKGWTVKKTGLGPLRWDVGFNASLVLVTTGAFMVAGAAVLRPLHRIPKGFDLLTEQAAIFGQISPMMVPLYYVTILTALWGTLNALPDIYARGIHSFLRQLIPRTSNLQYRQVMTVFGLVMLVVTWFLIWVGTTPIIMIDIVALFSTNLGVGLVCVAAVWLDRQLPAERRSSRPLWWATLLSAIVINLMAMLSAREVLDKYL